MGSYVIKLASSSGHIAPLFLQSRIPLGSYFVDNNRVSWHIFMSSALHAADPGSIPKMETFEFWLVPMCRMLK